MKNVRLCMQMCVFNSGPKYYNDFPLLFVSFLRVERIRSDKAKQKPALSANRMNQ